MRTEKRARILYITVAILCFGRWLSRRPVPARADEIVRNKTHWKKPEREFTRTKSMQGREILRNLMRMKLYNATARLPKRGFPEQVRSRRRRRVREKRRALIPVWAARPMSSKHGRRSKPFSLQSCEENRSASERGHAHRAPRSGVSSSTTATTTAPQRASRWFRRFLLARIGQPIATQHSKSATISSGELALRGTCTSRLVNAPPR